ncbi:MAG: hypothetical protein Q9M31_07965, partial [Mariprofundus sp.]|nr:hypothetical protein [Mariprofundus sp.]
MIYSFRGPKSKAIKLTDELKAKITLLIEEDWSTEQAVCRLKGDGFATVHHETIYQFILTDKKNGGQLHSHLR